MSKAIKIADAKRISHENNFDMVLVIGINNDRSGHITTYGKTIDLCKIAGEIGQEHVANLIFGSSGLLQNMKPKTKKNG